MKVILASWKGSIVLSVVIYFWDWKRKTHLWSLPGPRILERTTYYDIDGQFGLYCIDNIYMFFPSFHLCCTAHKNLISPILYTNLRLEAPLSVYFSCTTFRRSATSSAELLIPKCTTRRWTVRCFNYSLAKRQPLSCALSTATLLLKFKMWFQTVGFDYPRVVQV